MTIHERVAAARTRLLAAGIERTEANLDARLLAQWLLRWDATRFLAQAHEEEPADFHARYEALISRRAAREPLAYVTGSREFWGRGFEVSPGVLIPRPETEAIVEAALELHGNAHASLELADVGTGSGCLAVTLAVERPKARVVATDVSDEALAVAGRNAERHAVADRVELVRTDLLSGIDRTFDLIVANPPYVAEEDRATLQPEVRDYEPPAALFAHNRGLAVITRLLEQAVTHLAPAGRLIFELGYGQADAVRSRIAETPGLVLVEMRTDLRRIPRIAIVRLEAEAEVRDSLPAKPAT